MKIQNVNPFDFSRKVVRLTDNIMKNTVGGKRVTATFPPVTETTADECKTCVAGPNCEPDDT